jgi:probable HAF family extracellular repeat protein
MRAHAFLAAGLTVLGVTACRDEPAAPLAPGARLAVTTAPLAPATAPPQDLGTLGNAAQAFGISANGTVVGQFDTPSGEHRAFIWTSKTGMTQLPSPPGSTEDWAWSVNDGGQAAGYSSVPSQNAYLWSKGVPYNLGTLAGGDGASVARGINRLGQVVGSSNIQGAFGPTGLHAMLWVPNATNGTTGTMYDLGTLEEGGFSRAYSVNEAGQVVGAASVGGNLHAFLWTPNVPNGTVGTMVDLDPGGTYSEAYALNDRGDVVGQHAVAGGGVGAFIWNAATGMTDIGTFSGGGNSAADGVDRLGRVVGLAINSSGQWRPFVWTSKSGMQDLGTLGGANGEAFAANPKGQAVGFSQTAAGDVHATLWTLP